MVMALYSNATIKRFIIAANEIDNRIEYLNRRGIPTDIPNKPKQKLIEIGIWDDDGCFNPKYHDQTQYNFITDWYEKNYC
jgi:hypothetical protein